MLDLPGLVQEFRAFVDTSPSWRLASVRDFVGSCLDALDSARETDPLAIVECERRHAARAIGESRLLDPVRSPGPGWSWRTIGMDWFMPDGALQRVALECWTPPGFEAASALAAMLQRRREAMAVAMIVALHDELLAPGRLPIGALPGAPIVDDALLEPPDASGCTLSRRLAWSDLRRYAMAESDAAPIWLAGATQFLAAAGRDDLLSAALRSRPTSN